MDILHTPIFEGRPENTTNRLDKEIRTYDLLDSLHIPYQRIDHEAMPTIEACHDVDKRLGIHVCKNLFLCNTQKTNFYLLMMPGEKKFQTKVVSKQLGVARLSFAPEEYMLELLDITPGSVSVMGLMNDSENKIQLLMDRDLLKEEYLGCHPCINTSSLKLSTKDILEKFLPAVHHEAVFVDL
ncbi:prolyl-tRNA synthetase associated domain-containing protein [Roseburia sp. 499]|uniref:prolyl-tRNA synthetase associated domain-containing protein n=1 Tax=Roseburia sp. 499 TaxID=1261634 RepID=UPI0009521DBA|nr:prolyl-tRNA synthetase associated domain-containing protein [Roseburia sp. 499]WVK68631.1 prolyl-tRNA synthetase associated domain-containing protein [Roseburia sp. 499]